MPMMENEKFNIHSPKFKISLIALAVILIVVVLMFVWKFNREMKKESAFPSLPSASQEKKSEQEKLMESISAKKEGPVDPKVLEGLTAKKENPVSQAVIDSLTAK